MTTAPIAVRFDGTGSPRARVSFAINGKRATFGQFESANCMFYDVDFGQDTSGQFVVVRFSCERDQGRRAAKDRRVEHARNRKEKIK